MGINSNGCFPGVLCFVDVWKSAKQIRNFGKKILAMSLFDPFFCLKISLG